MGIMKSFCLLRKCFWGFSLPQFFVCYHFTNWDLEKYVAFFLLCVILYTSKYEIDLSLEIKLLLYYRKGHAKWQMEMHCLWNKLPTQVSNSLTFLSNCHKSNEDESQQFSENTVTCYAYKSNFLIASSISPFEFSKVRKNFAFYINLESFTFTLAD